MKHSELRELLVLSINNRMPVLVTGKPAIGKSDAMADAANEAGAELIISHPVVSDPTDYKGLPFANDQGEAHFLPFDELNKLIKADKPTVFFLDDLGQAPASVQAACMQLILARRINGHKVSDYVTFMAATNRRQDKAGVMGLLEPVKSRFASIVELEVNHEDWIMWALDKDMPSELIAFIRFRPALLDDFKPTSELVNSPSPRTVAAVGRWQKAGLPKSMEFEIFKGAAGEAFAIEYAAFLQLIRELPPIDSIIMNPDSAVVPENPASMYAVSTALAQRANQQNVENIMTYLKRVPEEFQVCSVKDMLQKTPQLSNSKPYIKWAVENANNII